MVYNNSKELLSAELDGFKPTAKDVWNCILLFPLYFIFIYMDTIPLALSPDLFWKLPTIIGLLIYVIYKTSDLKFQDFFIYGIALAVKQLLIISPKSQYYINAAGVAALDLVTPILTIFFMYSVSYKTSGKCLFFISCWLILATIPYHLGLLDNYMALLEKGEEVYDLGKFGGSGTIFTGPFANFHDAGITLSFAAAGALYFADKTASKFVKYFVLALAALAILSIYLTYARTSMVMVGLAFFVYFYIGRSQKQILYGVFITALAGLVFYLIYLSSTVLQLRLGNTNIYGTEAAAGSGRFDFWTIMIRYLTSNGFFSFLIGTGREAGRDYMYQEFGQRLFSHNGILDILVSAGCIGLFFFVRFQRRLYKRVLKWSNYKVLPSYKMVLICFAMYWSAIMFQGHQYFWVFIIVSIFVAILEKEYFYHTYQTKLERKNR